MYRKFENFTSKQGLNFDFNNNSNTVTNTEQIKYEYKILSQKDKLLSGKFDPANLEIAINAYAQQGWRVLACTTADITGLGPSRQEFIAILERQVK